jgi:hypothetical protein
MGVTTSVPLSKCVEISSLPYWNQSYTVKRSSGELQEGWIIDPRPHRCANNTLCEPPAAHALLRPAPGERGLEWRGEWRVHLHNGDPPHFPEQAHVCGWRPLGTFWPTQLTGKQEEIDTWTVQFRADIERLALVQGIPTEYWDCVCAKGSPPDLCMGCGAQRQAKGKQQEALGLSVPNLAPLDRPPTPPPAALAATQEPELDDLDAALEALGARPYHPVYAPLEKTG